MSKKTIPSRSSKQAMLKAKANLPEVASGKPEVTPPDAGPGVIPDKPEVNPPDAGPEVKLDLTKLIPPTGTIRALGCNGFNLLLRAKKRLPLTQEQYKLLGEPLDKVEAEAIKLLPDWLKDQVEKNGPLAGALIEVSALAIVIWKLNKLPEVTLEVKPDKPEVKPPDAGPGVTPEVK